MDDSTEYRARDAEARHAGNTRIQQETRPSPNPSAAGHRRHMGVATNDPEYLEAAGRAARQHPQTAAHHQLHANRYLELPTSRKTIFTAGKERTRAHRRLVIIAALVVAVAALVWWFLLR